MLGSAISKFKKFFQIPDKFNPFLSVIETRTFFSYDRMLRTSFGQKIIDGFVVLVGSQSLTYGLFKFLFGSQRYQEQFGLLDWLTLGVLSVPLILSNFLLDSLLWLPLKYILIWLISLFVAVSEIVRALIATILLLNPLSLLIIGMIHFVSQGVAGGSKLKQTISTIPIKDIDSAYLCDRRIKFILDTTKQSVLGLAVLIIGQECFLSLPHRPGKEATEGTLVLNPEQTKAVLKLNFLNITKELEVLWNGNLDYYNTSFELGSLTVNEYQKLYSRQAKQVINLCLSLPSDPEIIKNAWVLAQAVRTQTGAFSFWQMPKELIEKIISFTGSSGDFNDEETVLAIAMTGFVWR